MHYLSAIFYTFYMLLNNQYQNAEANATVRSWADGPAARLEIRPHFISKMGHNLILKMKNESVNVTCTVEYEEGFQKDSLFDYVLDWEIPFHVMTTLKVHKGQAKNIAWFSFERLTESHSGNYTCMDVTKIKRGQPLIPINIHLSVKNNITYCGSQWFICRSSKYCIMERYKCDGIDDCEEGEDESSEAGCQPDPCYGKVLCDDRCIPPDWCCEHRNCNNSFGFRPWQPDTHDINYVQTALYHTVIGWAMAFMFIVTILLIAICRVHIKRAVDSRWWQHHQNICHQPEQTLPHGVNIMYNLDSVVQFMGPPIDPPPYSEVVGLPPQERPPPTYESCEHLSDESNRNSDIEERRYLSPIDVSPPLSLDISFDRTISTLDQSPGFDIQHVETDTLLSNDLNNYRRSSNGC